MFRSERHSQRPESGKLLYSCSGPPNALPFSGSHRHCPKRIWESVDRAKQRATGSTDLAGYSSVPIRDCHWTSECRCARIISFECLARLFFSNAENVFGPHLHSSSKR
ncbi:hypothetical protein Y032_0018g3670 [Ancylostoma ceylanicum]|uniref:Uncharacterized protein n=1 Tax=Ancylostoma ceylanicum TaxID=53326 RepID=A0A016V478_9BILA|nr:hypothetical protein Y032_0018g3670 [Ancylostoma ceylanicum]